MVDAHDQTFTHHYTVRYPAHPEREDDPHYADFREYRRRTKDTAVCAKATAIGSTDECGGGMELHHAHVEFAMQNGIDLAVLEDHYPGISNPSQVGAWVESAENLVWLCERHHRSDAGVHVASASDYEAETFIRDLIETPRIPGGQT